jgi:uncharacterized surface protein with fasciclin (FAS1) repeats
MFKTLIFFLSSIALVSSTLRGTFSEVDEIIESDRELKSSATIASLVKSNAMFDTLEAALEATGLDKTLQGSGPFTVFAPTDKVSDFTNL